MYVVSLFVLALWMVIKQTSSLFSMHICFPTGYHKTASLIVLIFFLLPAARVKGHQKTHLLLQ
jgi:hypothetical protein